LYKIHYFLHIIKNSFYYISANKIKAPNIIKIILVPIKSIKLPIVIADAIPKDIGRTNTVIIVKNLLKLFAFQNNLNLFIILSFN